MASLHYRFEQLDTQLTNWMARYSIVLLRIGLGLIFFWFGLLKFFPQLSPAQELATRTISVLSFGLMTPAVSLPLLAAWECLIGLGLISGRWMRATLLLLVLQMMGTVTPLFLFPSESFSRIPFAPTLEGQYIIKNIVLVCAGLVIGATVRGGHLVIEGDDNVSVARADKVV